MMNLYISMLSTFFSISFNVQHFLLSELALIILKSIKETF